MHLKKNYYSIKSLLLLSFFLLSLVPLFIVSSYIYKQTFQSTLKIQHLKLKYKAQADMRMLEERFNTVINNLNYWSQSIDFEGFLNKNFQEYNSTQSIENILKHYNSIDNLFLIKINGEILYTVNQKKDFNTNLQNGPYKYTLFAQILRATIDDNKPHFSDLELFPASKEFIASFITMPIFNKKNELIGVLGIQLNLKNLVQDVLTKKDEIQSYLVGEDSLLRTPIQNNDELLNRHINTREFLDWYHEDKESKSSKDTTENEASIYLDFNGTKVLGEHLSLNILGVRWGYFCEIEEKFLDIVPSDFTRNIIIILFFSTLVVIISAIIMARRLTQPIKELSDASIRYLNGEKFIRAHVQNNNEIGDLAQLFNTLLEVQESDKKQILLFTNEMNDTLQELKIQKHALDIHALVSITDIYGNITFANSKFEAISGYTNKELLGKNHRILNSNIHTTEFWLDMYNTINQGHEWHQEVCNRAKDGHLYWVDTNIIPFFAKDGKIEQYISIRTDITQQKYMQLLLAEKEEFLQTLLDSVAEGIYGLDINGNCTFVNKSFLRILGFKDESQLIGKHMHEIIHHSHQDGSTYKSLHCNVCRVNKTFNPVHIDNEIFFKQDGESLNVEYWSFPIRRNSIYTGLVVTFLDISERKKIEIEILAAKKAAESLADMKSEFLATMSHEIRTPMNGILGMLEILNLSELTDKQKHQIQISSDSANSLLNIINDILDFSKVEAGKMQLEMIEFNLLEILENIIKISSFKAAEKNIKIVLDTTSLTREIIISDPGRLRQILTNLISNAIKFTYKGDIQISVLLKEITQTQARLYIDVQDRGIGIAPEKIETLFESFVQADNSTTRKYGGTGLGLAIVKKLCTLMNGSVCVISTVNEGSTFHVDIKVELSQNKHKIPQGQNAIEQNQIDEAEVTWPKNTKLLLVEDNLTNQLVITEMLKILGLDCDVANNGIEALSKMRESLPTNLYTTILMDCQMPLMDGYVATESIRIAGAGERYKTIPIIALTANAMSSDRERCLISGMDDFISKPVDIPTLKKVLSKWLISKHDKIIEAEPIKEEKTTTSKNFRALGLWNKEIALKQLGNNEALLNKVVQSFMAETHKIMDNLQDAFSKKNFEEVQLHAHSLKGSSANIGATALYEISKMVEFAAKEKDILFIQNNLDECQNITNETIQILSNHVIKDITPKKKKRHVDALSIAIALQELQMKIAKEIAIDTNSVAIFVEYTDENITLLIQKLKSELDIKAYEKAKETIQKVMDTLEM